MPATFSRTFRIRQYECDIYGHVNNSNYIRFMQETALDASADVGWDLDHYNAIGHRWLIRETDIEYLNALTYGDSVDVKTWVEDFRRVRSRRAYEFRKSGTDALVARASTDWIYLDLASNKPAQIPEDIILAYHPEGVPQQAPPRPKFPQQPAPPAGIFKLYKRVEWRDVDIAGHMNNAAYFNFIEDASTQVAQSFNWPMSRIEQEGFAIIARNIRMEYLQPALLDDVLEVSTWVSDVKRVTAMRHYTVKRADDTLLARASSTWVWVDLKTMRPIRVPANFLADFAPNVSG